ncbi:hypothetical protein AcdelDRAFT_1890 [Acidovorax delafieldii 2AN]|uniref:Uncharacterized protein n=1 Tax=Acidovorax delafieldii 2AN TaxID=573060 RepID=C5T4R0_ACIDE|nr:hypothetical protein [Acidovorax delafieldii]EER60553.1 hypothetical protein AcdelDRAFT_1890 [Acidovorax delafieldii 2AN]
MTAWILLLLTLCCVWLCVDASKLNAPLRDKHPNTPEGNSRVTFEGIYAPFGLGVLAWLFLAMSILLGVLTVREFLA